MTLSGRKQPHEICDGDELCCEIEDLKARKSRQEQELKDSFYEMAHSVNPVNLMKDAIHGLATVRPPDGDLITLGTSIGSNYLIDKVLGKNQSIKGFVSALIVEKISEELIKRNAPQMLNQLIDWGNKIGIDLEDRI